MQWCCYDPNKRTRYTALLGSSHCFKLVPAKAAHLCSALHSFGAAGAGLRVLRSHLLNADLCETPLMLCLSNPRLRREVRLQVLHQDKD